MLSCFSVGPEHIALYPYTGPAGDLSFSEGDVIRVTKKDGEWWEGSINGRSGMFPATYVSPKNDAAVTSPPAQVWLISPAMAVWV